MKHTTIESLLERYWEGETTLEDERRLKAYFQSDNIDPRFLEFAPLFRVLTEAQQVAAPHHIGMLQQTQTMQVTYRKTWLRIAAAAVLTGAIASAVWFLAPNDPVNTVVTTTPPVVMPPAPDTLETVKVQSEVAQTETKVSIPVGARKKKRTSVPAAPQTTPGIVPEKQEEAYTEAEALQALEEVKAALALVSSKMNKGAMDVSKPLKKVHFDQYLNGEAL